MNINDGIEAKVVALFRSVLVSLTLVCLAIMSIQSMVVFEGC